VTHVLLLNVDVGVELDNLELGDVEIVEVFDLLAAHLVVARHKRDLDELEHFREKVTL